MTGAQSVSFRQGSNVEFGVPAHERMVRNDSLNTLSEIKFERRFNEIVCSKGTSGR